MASYKISISLRSIQDTITWLSKKWFVSNVNVLDFVGEIGGTIKKWGYIQTGNGVAQASRWLRSTYLYTPTGIWKAFTADDYGAVNQLNWPPTAQRRQLKANCFHSILSQTSRKVPKWSIDNWQDTTWHKWVNPYNDRSQECALGTYRLYNSQRVLFYGICLLFMVVAYRERVF